MDDHSCPAAGNPRVQPLDLSSALIGHNGGPPLDEPDPALSWRLWCWRRAQKKAWSAPRELVQRRLARATALGMSYHDYTLEILERGKYL